MLLFGGLSPLTCLCRPLNVKEPNFSMMIPVKLPVEPVLLPCDCRSESGAVTGKVGKLNVVMGGVTNFGDGIFVIAGCWLDICKLLAFVLMFPLSVSWGGLQLPGDSRTGARPGWGFDVASKLAERSRSCLFFQFSRILYVMDVAWQAALLADAMLSLAGKKMWQGDKIFAVDWHHTDLTSYIGSCFTLQCWVVGFQQRVHYYIVAWFNIWDRVVTNRRIFVYEAVFAM